MTKWKTALLRAARHVSAAIEETKDSSGWLPLCITYRRIEAAQAELEKARAELDQMKAIQSWRTSGLNITLVDDDAKLEAL